MEGLPPGVKFEEGYGFVGAAGAGAAGKYKITAEVTGGGATDQLTFRWTVIQADRTAAAFAFNGTLTDKDDIAVVGQQQPVRIKYFLSGASRGPIKVEVSGDGDALTTKKGDMVGKQNLIFQPTDLPIGWLDMYLIAKAVGQTRITAFHSVDGKWVKMD
jgi:hypothetical protein